jgi:peptidoglycan hydrolase CwlO-like protein
VQNDFGFGALWALAGAAATAVIAGIFGRPRSKAEARKLNAEASGIEWQSLKAEVDRLTLAVDKQGAEIAQLKEQAVVRADRATELEKENKSLKAEVGRLKNRVKALENIFKIGPITPEMQAELDKLKEVP